MKKLILSLVIASLSVLVLAQAPGPAGGGVQKGGGPGEGKRPSREEMMQMRKDVMAKMNFSADKKAKLAKLDKEFMEKGKALRAAGKPGVAGAPAAGSANPNSDPRAKMQELRKWRADEEAKILSKDEIKKMRELMGAWMKDHGYDWGRGGGAGKGAGKGKGPGN